MDFLNIERKNQLSKFVSFILRHKPYKFGIELDPEGFCSIEELLKAIIKESYWKDTTVDDIHFVVKTCNKKRFEIENDYIRARYGHSKQGLVYKEKTPPAILYHGTYSKVLDKILKEGIKKMGRDYVHLSETTDFAIKAGVRRGKAVILEIDTKKALCSGVKFFYSGDEVWLSHYISPGFLKIKK